MTRPYGQPTTSNPSPVAYPQADPPNHEGKPQGYPPQQPQPQEYPPQQGQLQPQGYPTQLVLQGPQQMIVQPPVQTGYQEMQFAQMATPAAATINTIPMGFPTPQQLVPQDWNTGLFGCFDDPLNALVTLCFPCVTFGQIAEILDNGTQSCACSALLYFCIAYFIGCPCIISCTYRSKLRGRYGLIESPAPDCLTHCFCEWCALCQEYRELKSRDLDPALGWQGNMAKQRNIQLQQASMTPPMNPTMMR